MSSSPFSLKNFTKSEPRDSYKNISDKEKSVYVLRRGGAASAYFVIMIFAYFCVFASGKSDVVRIYG